MARSILIKVALVVALVGFTAGPSRAAKKSPKGPPIWEVQVVNTPADPVPVIQVGPVDVNIPTPLPVVSDDPVYERIPYNKTIGRTLADGESAVIVTLADVPSDIPNGATLVVETVSYQVELPAGQSARVVFSSNSNTGVFRAWMPQAAPFVASGGADWIYADAKVVRFYARPGQVATGGHVLATIVRNNNMGEGDFQAAVSGYILMDASPDLAP